MQYFCPQQFVALAQKIASYMMGKFSSALPSAASLTFIGNINLTQLMPKGKLYYFAAV